METQTMLQNKIKLKYNWYQDKMLVISRVEKVLVRLQLLIRSLGGLRWET